MKILWLWANPAERAACRPHRATGLLFKRDGLHIHSAQTGEQKCRAEALSIDLAIYLVGRFLDSQPLKHFRQLLVTDAAPPHLDFYRFFRGLLPRLVRLGLRDTPARQFVHRYSLAFRRPYFFVPIFSHDYFQSYATGASSTCLYDLSKFLYEDKLLTTTLPNSPDRQNGIIFLITTHAVIQWLSHGGTK